MLISNRKISENSYQFLPELLTKQLAGKAHKATYKKEAMRHKSLPKRFVLTKGNLLVFNQHKGQFIFADHLWRICKLLDHNQKATLTLTDEGIEITQPKQRAFLKWLTRWTPLDISLVRWH